MSRKNIGLGLLILGILVFAVSLAADYLGLGTSGGHVIGWKQWLGAGVGFVIAAAGIFLSLQSKKSKA